MFPSSWFWHIFILFAVYHLVKKPTYLKLAKFNNTMFSYTPNCLLNITLSSHWMTHRTFIPLTSDFLSHNLNGLHIRCKYQNPNWSGGSQNLINKEKRCILSPIQSGSDCSKLLVDWISGVTFYLMVLFVRPAVVVTLSIIYVVSIFKISGEGVSAWEPQLD